MTMTTRNVRKKRKERKKFKQVCVYAQKAIITIHIAQNTDHSLWVLLLAVFGLPKQCTIRHISMRMCGSMCCAQNWLFRWKTFFEQSTKKILSLLRLSTFIWIFCYGWCDIIHQYRMILLNLFPFCISLCARHLSYLKWVNGSGRNQMNLMALESIVWCTIRSWNEVICRKYNSAIAEKSENEYDWNGIAGKQIWHQDFDAALVLWKTVDGLQKKELKWNLYTCTFFQSSFIHTFLIVPQTPNVMV